MNVKTAFGSSPISPAMQYAANQIIESNLGISDRQDLGDLLLFFCKRLSSEELSNLSEALKLKPFKVLLITENLSNDGIINEWDFLNLGVDAIIKFSSIERSVREVQTKITRIMQIESILTSELVQSNLIGKSQVWLQLVRKAIEVALYSKGDVLILGDTGTGKELVARVIHALDKIRSNKPLTIVDCTTLQPELMGSELFGHEKGAFTGAESARDGAFKSANFGMLFIDEVGDLHLPLQSKLLRAIQERKVKRIGSDKWPDIDVRLIFATHRKLDTEVQEKRFRQDLYYRITDNIIALPPLNLRREDILPLAEHFFRNELNFDGIIELSPCLSSFLVSRDYPGNVRDLRRLVSRMATRHTGNGVLTASLIPEDERPYRPPFRKNNAPTEVDFESAILNKVHMGIPLQDLGRMAKTTAIRLTIEEEQGNLQRAAKRLGVTDRSLQIYKSQSKPPKDSW